MTKDTLGPMETTSLADQAYRRLRDAIRGGALRPGEKITERDLAARLGVSPTPIREALRQLVHGRSSSGSARARCGSPTTPPLPVARSSRPRSACPP
ncbi:GntR family transcriptional regulator [Streptomyces mirabilis]|nr:GntR family transcriptional regulator [Streptomyces mirabilis]